MRKVLIPCVLVLAAGLGACGGGQSNGAVKEQGGSGAGDRPSLRIAFAMLGVTGDAFFDVTRNGAKQAAKDQGAALQYQSTSTIDTQDHARLIDAAVAQHPDGLVTQVLDPKVEGPPILRAIKQGIPVVITNLGKDFADRNGALAYVGVISEYQNGLEAGKQLKAAGLHKVYCVNQVVGAANLDDRCRGLAAGFGGPTKVIGVDNNDPTASENRIAAVLQHDEGFDGMLGLGRTATEPALKALQETGKADKVKLATMDLSPAILQALRDKRLLFAADQQEYYQGYMPVQILAQFKRYGLRLPSDVATGPNFVRPADAQRVIDLAKQNIR